MKRKTTNSEQIELDQNENGRTWETQGLFSDYYLRKKLPATVYWPKDSVCELAYQKCRGLFEKNKYRLGKFGHEDDAKMELIQPIIELLGFEYTTQPTMPGIKKQTPDYLFFADKAQKEAALNFQPKARYPYAISLGEAKKYGFNLGGLSEDESSRKFPHQQVRDYLSDAVDSSLRKPFFNWAILTNGRDWRLYYRYAQSYSYFAFNLEYGSNSRQHFKYFWTLFNAASFVKDNNDICHLDKILDQSIQHSTALENDLRLRVYRLLERLARGFYSRKQNKITADNLEDLYDTCLIYMYRLLFVLYAEGWDLLPVTPYRASSSQVYRETFSLERLKSSIRKVKPEDDVLWRLYNELDELFTLINGNDEALNKRLGVPRYNGGLFDPERTKQLKHWRVGNYTLAEVLEGLMYSFRHTKPGETEEMIGEEAIDYSELNVRQLGSIYEGLLDHHLEIDEQSGEIQLVDDKNDDSKVKRQQTSKRKQSGSYYTPDFIVQYILNQTVKPQIEEIEADPKIKLALASGIKDNSYAERVLKLKILDPAMGSGHFLVKATEMLAEEIASHPTTILAVKFPPANVPHEFEEIAYWRRKVVENCVYGVDINPLAVELAKLSLWLTCISSQRPLSFIDHHIQCGNALIGTTLSELDHLKRAGETTRSLLIIDGLDIARKEAVEQLELLRKLESSAFDSVKEKENIWKNQVKKRIASFSALADLRSAFDLGFNLEDKEYAQYADEVLSNPASLPQIASGVCDLFRVFHWELAFPEVFPANGAVGGFDIVIGNPPYVRSRVIGETKDYLSGCYESYNGSADLSIYFIERGMKLLRPGGRFGFIVPNKWMRADYGKSLQTFVRKFQIETLADFGELKVFKSSSTFPLVMILQNCAPTQAPKYIALKELIKDSDQLEVVIKRDAFPLVDEAFKPGGFTLVRAEHAQILDKMKEAGTPLGRLVERKMYYGIKTGFNQAFIIDAAQREKLIRGDRRSAELIVPFIIGDDVRKWQVNYRDRFLILTPIGVEIDEYPAIFDHLKTFQEQLEARWDKGKHWWELRACTYYEEFAKPKIIWPEIAKESRFAFDDKKYYANKTTFILPSQDFYLLGVLNSQVVWEYLKRTCSVLGDPDKGGRLTQQLIYVEKIPIPAASVKTKAEITELVKQILMLKDNLAISAGLAESRRLETQIGEAECEIDKMVYTLYGLGDKEIAIFEGKK